MGKDKAGLSDVALAMVRIADSLDRLTWVVENLAVGLDLVHPDDIGPSEVVKKVLGE